MTPKIKAEFLIMQFIKHSRAESYITPLESAKQFALIAVDEIWNALESARVFEEYDYWQEVKNEIKNL